MKLLVSVGHGLGNVIMTTPLIGGLAEAGHEVDVLMDSPSWPWRVAWERWGAVGHWHPHGGGLSTKYAAVLRTVWGPRALLRSVPEVPASADLRTTHEADANYALGERFGAPARMPPPHVEFDVPRGIEQAPYVVLAPGCNPSGFWAKKKWGGWAELAARLVGVPVAVLGAEGDCPAGVLDVPGVRSFCGGPLREAGGWLRRAACVVTLDCGLAHYAGALGAPVLVLQGPTSMRKNRPWGPRVEVLSLGLQCAPCQMTSRWETCTEPRCMEGLTPEFVAEQVCSLL